MCPSFNSADVSTSASAVHLIAVHHLKTLHPEAESSGWQNFVFTYGEVIPLPSMLFLSTTSAQIHVYHDIQEAQGQNFPTYRAPSCTY